MTEMSHFPCWDGNDTAVNYNIKVPLSMTIRCTFSWLYRDSFLRFRHQSSINALEIITISPGANLEKGFYLACLSILRVRHPGIGNIISFTPKIQSQIWPWLLDYMKPWRERQYSHMISSSAWQVEQIMRSFPSGFHKMFIDAVFGFTLPRYFSGFAFSVVSWNQFCRSVYIVVNKFPCLSLDPEKK